MLKVWCFYVELILNVLFVNCYGSLNLEIKFYVIYYI